MKKIFENLKKWQNYMHYLALTVSLVVLFHFMGIHAFHTDMFLPNLNFVKLYVGLTVFDTIVHLVFFALPKPYRWRD